MRATVPFALVAAGVLLTPAFAPAAAVEAQPETSIAVDSRATAVRYLFMVRNVHLAGEIYTGRFTVIAKSGHRVVGAYGKFYSEARCLVGRVDDGWLRGKFPGFTYGGEWIPEMKFAARWRGYGSAQHMKGWTPVSADDMRAMSGGGVDGTVVESICSSV